MRARSIGVVGASFLAAFDVASQVPTVFAAPRTQVPSPRVRQQLNPLMLKVRRLPQAVEVVIEGAGGTAEIAGVVMGSEWVGRLVPARPSQLAQGDQAVSLPDGGYQSISLVTVEGGFQVRVRPLDGRPALSPVVRGDGTSLILSFPATGQVQSQNASYDLSRPGRLPQPDFAPALRPRAVAPPLGDMAVGTMMLRNPSYVNVSGPPVMLTTRDANARDVLMVLAQMGGYNFAFSNADDSVGGGAGSSGGAASSGGTDEMRLPITVSFKNEPYGRAFNFVLLVSGLQARLQGRTVLVGRNVLSKTLDAQMSKVFRLNQVSPDGAADYLANLGARINKTNTVTFTTNEGSSTSTGGGAAVGGSTTSQTSSETTTQTVVESYGASTGPLVGLQGVTDSRLGTITLVGDSAAIAIAESYLRQLDLRKRQVAIKIEIINVDLGNDLSAANSFTYKSKSGFSIISSGGGFTAAYDSSSPSGGGGQFTDFLEAAIESSSAKTLASPTLLIQEGSKAEVEAVKSVITAVVPIETPEGVVISCSQTREDAGLKVPIEVSKIDDNGFITLSMKPEVSVPELAGQGRCAADIPIFNIVKRSLDSGAVRLREGQTLVVTGVIQDDQRALVTKIPLLGDVPIIGQFFRRSSTSRQKSELIILATPHIVRDGDSLPPSGYGSLSLGYSAP